MISVLYGGNDDTFLENSDQVDHRQSQTARIAYLSTAQAPL